MTCTPHLERPTAWEVAYVCDCGWESSVVPSDQTAKAGRELVAHMSGGRIPHTPPRPEPRRRRARP